MRESATALAPPYITGAMYQVECGHHSLVSATTAAAAEKAAVACPDGNDLDESDLNPRPNLKSCELVSPVAYGLFPPAIPLMMSATPAPTTTASVPCTASSAMRGT